jgi:hypothetical protein
MFSRIMIIRLIIMYMAFVFLKVYIYYVIFSILMNAKKSITIPIFIVLAGLLLTMTSFSSHNIFAAETNIPNSNSLKGALASIQNDKDGKPAWIVSGVFKIDNYSNNGNNNNASTSPILNATFYMVKLDGTSKHNHTVSDFKITGKPQTSGNSTAFNGTSTVTMKEGPVTNVPTSIKLLDNSVITMWFDPTKVENHFGNTPIYGTHHLICVEKPQLCASIVK